jgi:hypothetical protein
MSASTLRFSHSTRRATAATQERWSNLTAALIWSAVSAALWAAIISTGSALF